MANACTDFVGFVDIFLNYSRYLPQSKEDAEDVSKFLQLVTTLLVIFLIINLRRMMRLILLLLMQIKYVTGSYDTAEGFQALDKAITEQEISKNIREGLSRRLFYLALPPSVYPQVCKMIKSYCMNKCICSFFRIMFSISEN